MKQIIFTLVFLCNVVNVFSQDEPKGYKRIVSIENLGKPFNFERNPSFIVPFSCEFRYSENSIDSIIGTKTGFLKYIGDKSERYEQQMLYYLTEYDFLSNNFPCVSLHSFNEGLIDISISSDPALYSSALGKLYSYEYDSSGRIITIKDYYSLSGKDQEINIWGEDNTDEVLNNNPHLQWDLAWENGNIIGGTLKANDVELGSFTCTYYEDVCDNQYCIFNTPIHKLIYSYVPIIMQVERGWYGKTCMNYLKSIEWNIGTEVLEKDYNYHFSFEDLYLTYEKDADGYVTSVAGYYPNYEPMLIHWETYDDIKSPELDKLSNQPALVYDLQGRRLSQKPQKGIYIENGKKKVVR